MESLKSPDKYILSLSLALYAVFLPISKSAVYFSLTVIVIFSLYTLSRHWNKIFYPVYLKRLIFFGLMLISWQALTLLINGIPAETLNQPFNRAFNFLPIFALPIISASKELKTSITRQSLFTLLFITSFIILLGMIQNITGIVYSFPKQPFSHGELVGFFGHHIEAGGFFSTLAVLSICLISFWQKSKRLNLMLLALLFLLLLGVFFSLARTYYVSLLITVLMVLIRKNWRTSVLYISIIAVFISTIMVISPHIRERVFSISDLKKNLSNVERLYIWKTSVDIIVDNPISGVGFKQWRNRFPEYAGKYSDYWRFTEGAYHHAHNLYLSVAAETGIVGLSIFLIFWLYLLYNIFNNAKRFSEGSFDKAFTLGTMFGLINLLIGGLFEENFGKPANMFLLSFLISLSFFIGAVKQNDQ